MAGWLEDTLGIPGMQPAQDPFALQQPQLAPPPMLDAPPAAAANPPLPDASEALGAMQVPSGPAAPRPAKAPKQSYEQTMAENLAMQREAIMARAAKQQAAADYETAHVAAAETKRANDERELEAMRSKVYADVDQRQQAIIAEAQAASKIDPSGGLRNAPGGAQLALGIMGFLQGFVDTKNGPQKMAAWVDNFVQRNIAAQMADLEQQNRVIGLKQGALDRDAARAGQLLDARLAATARSYDGAMRMIATEAKRLGGSAEQDAQLAIGALQQNYADKAETIRQERQKIGLQGAAVALQKRAQDMQWAEQNLNRMADITKSAQNAKAAAAELAREQAKLTFVSPLTGKPLGTAYDADSLHKAQDLSKEHTNFLTAASRYREMIVKYGQTRQGGPARSQAAKDLETAHAALFREAKKMAGAGAALTESEIENMISPLAPKPQGWTDLQNPLYALDAAIDSATAGYNAGMSNYFPNYQPVAMLGRRDGAAPVEVREGQPLLPAAGEGAPDVRQSGMFAGIPNYTGFGPIDYLEHGGRQANDWLLQNLLGR